MVGFPYFLPFTILVMQTIFKCYPPLAYVALCSVSLHRLSNITTTLFNKMTTVLAKINFDFHHFALNDKNYNAKRMMSESKALHQAFGNCHLQIPYLKTKF